MDRRSLGRRVLAAAIAPWLARTSAAAAQAVELLALDIVRRDADVTVDFALRVALPTIVEDALRRGVVLHFRAEAALYRPRWYWRDLRLGRVRRHWRLGYQPLTNSFRVSTGALHQTYADLAEAMAAITRGSRWSVAAAADVEPGASHYLEFGWRLDTGELPRPMQIGGGNLPEWQLEIERRVEWRA